MKRNPKLGAQAASGATDYAEKDRQEKIANEFFIYLRNRQNWENFTTRLHFEEAYHDFIGRRLEPIPFDSLWKSLKVVVESWFFMQFLRTSKLQQQKVTKDQLRTIYNREYRSHIEERGQQTVAADFGRVLKLALYKGKLIELDGYIYVGDTESALAEALTQARDPAEMARRMAKKQSMPDRFCEVCDVLCCDSNQLGEHLRGRRHKVQHAIGGLRDMAMKRDLIRNKDNVQVTADVEFDSATGSYTFEVEVGQRANFHIIVNNVASASNSFITPFHATSTHPHFGNSNAFPNMQRDNAVVIEEFLYLFRVDCVFFNDTGTGLIRGHPITLPAGDSFSLQVSAVPQKFPSRAVIPVVFVLRRRATNAQFRILRFIKVECVRDLQLYRALKPKSADGAMAKPVPTLFQPVTMAGAFRTTAVMPNKIADKDKLGNSDSDSDSGVARSRKGAATSWQPQNVPQRAYVASSIGSVKPVAVKHDEVKVIKGSSDGDALSNQFKAKLHITKPVPPRETTPSTVDRLENATRAKLDRQVLPEAVKPKPAAPTWRNQTGQTVVLTFNNAASNGMRSGAAGKAARVASANITDSVRIEGDKRIVEAPKLERMNKPVPGGLSLREIGEFPVPDKYVRMHTIAERANGMRRRTIGDEIMHNLLKQKVDESNFTLRFDMLLYLEEIQMRIDLERYTIKSAKLTHSRDNEYLLKVPGVLENRPCVLRGDLLHVTLVDKPGTVYEALVESVEIDSDQALKENTALLRLRFGQSFVYLKNQTNATVQFLFDRLPLRYQHETLQTLQSVLSQPASVSNSRLNMLSTDPSDRNNSELESGRLRALLFPNRNRYSAYKRQPSGVAPRKFFNPSLNEEQRRCVQRIVSGDHYPVPFLIFGPPGTGKTVTLSEAIRQVHCCLPTSFLLICTPENTSADHIIQTLLAHGNIQRREILRLYAASRFHLVPDFVSSSRCEYEFLEDGYPDAATLQSYRIVVTTLNTASRLVYSGFPRHHFTHLFIDEAGHAMETELLVPIIGMLDLTRENGGQLIMAGDPRQLGVTIRSKVAQDYRLDTSFLERLIDPENQTKKQNAGSSNIYHVERKGNTDLHLNLDSADAMPLNIPLSSRIEFDDRILVKLRRNYRSHDAIIGFAREWFYHKDLEACADQLSRNAFIGWEELPNKQFPVLFHPVIGSDEHERESPSYFNRHEVMVIDYYLKALLTEKRGMKVEPKDIGIISPYMGQNRKIVEMIQIQQYNQQGRVAPKTTRSDVGILVGTVEELQGQERTVIIISTVRSSEKLLRKEGEFQVGFVDHRNREGFNVCSKRFNVALTRAKSLLIVIGNPFILEKDFNWKRWLDYCDGNGAWKISRPRFEMLRSTAMVNDVLVDDDHEMDDESGASVVELLEEPRWTRRD